MSIFAKITPAPKPRTKDVTPITILFAALLAIMALAQLFTFEYFLELMMSFQLPFGEQGTYFITALLVISEIFALPFLLRMPLSRGFRWVSLGFSLVAVALWLKLTFWVVSTQPDVENIGFLGTVAGLVPGWWALFVSIALSILAIWAAWGLWPGKRKN